MGVFERSLMGQIDHPVFDILQQPELLQVGDDLFAGLEHGEPPVRARRFSFSVPSRLRMLIIGKFCRKPTS